jgi:hypothetical protein
MVNALFFYSGGWILIWNASVIQAYANHYSGRFAPIRR